MIKFMSFLSFIEIFFTAEKPMILRFFSNLSYYFNIFSVIQKLLLEISCIKAR
jgi:hypothetical protein